MSNQQVAAEVVYGPGLMAQYQLDVPEISELNAALGVLKTHPHITHLTVTLLNGDLKVDLIDNTGELWCLWNPPNSGNYVLMRWADL